MKKLTKESLKKAIQDEEDKEEEITYPKRRRIFQMRERAKKSRIRERSRQKQYLLKRREEFRSTANIIIAMMGSRHRAVVDAKEI